MKDNNQFKVNEMTPKSIELPYVIIQANQTPKNMRKNYEVTKNILYASQKVDKLKTQTSLNMGRLIPKCISRDKQDLYQQNIKLKNQIKLLNSQVVKSKTRINILEEQKAKITSTNADKSIKKPGQKQRKQSHIFNRKNQADKSSSKIPLAYLQNSTQIKTIFRQNKDETSIIKNEMQKLKKSLKYTQNSQIAIQNEQLHSQCFRLTKIIEQLKIENAKQIKLLSGNLRSLNQQNQKNRQINTHLSTQLREKMLQIDFLKSELKKIGQKQKNMQKQLVNIKKSKQVLNESSKKEVSGQQQKRKKSSKNYHIEQLVILNEQFTINKMCTTKKVKQVTKETNSQNKIKNIAQQAIQALKQLITYRFKYHRYTFDDFVTDIQKTNIQQFSIQQLNGMLSHQPFYLNKQQISLVLNFIKGQNNAQINQSIKLKEILHQIRHFVDNFSLLDEQKELQFTKKWRKILKESKEIKRQHSGKKSISRKQFQNIIIGTLISPGQIDLLLSQASIVSTNLDTLNFQAFLNQFLQ